MSVPTDKRKPSLVQFITTAQELHTFTIKRLVKLPGIHKSYIYEPLAQLVNSVLQGVTYANGLSKVENPEYSERRSILKKAQADLISMYKYVDYIFENCNTTKDGKTIIKEGSRVEWYQLIKNEQNLIAGVLASDKKAFDKYNQKGDSTVSE